MIAVLAFTGLLFLALGLMAWLADRHADAPVKQPPPARQRIPADEMRLTGPDYRVHTDAYFARKSRRREIVRDLTGAE